LIQQVSERQITIEYKFQSFFENFNILLLLISEPAHVHESCEGNIEPLHIKVLHHFQHFAWLKPQPVSS